VLFRSPAVDGRVDDVVATSREPLSDQVTLQFTPADDVTRMLVDHSDAHATSSPAILSGPSRRLAALRAGGGAGGP
jgi:hypothetical protein